jgi:hypothetical protein
MLTVTGVTSSDRCRVVCLWAVQAEGRRSRMTDFGWGLVLLGVYVLLVILARWLCIARANVVWNQAQSAALGKRLLLQLARASSTNGKVVTPQATLDELVQEINKKNPQGRFSGVVGWNGSHQIAQWVLMHEAERLALPTLRHE